MNKTSRRDFLKRSICIAGATVAGGQLSNVLGLVGAARHAALVSQREPAAAQQAGVEQRTGQGQGVEITETAGKLRVEINGELFTEYNFEDVPKPYFYPVIGPTGENITRHWPMKEGENEEHDHPHQRSLWFGHGDVNGQDFWSEEKGFGRIVHDKFLEVSSGADVGVFKTGNKWVASNGKVVCTDTRVHRFYNRPGCKMMDFEITIEASEGDVRLGDTKEGTMAIRVAETMRLKGKVGEVGEGHIVNSEGLRDGQTWGKRAAWCDYYGPVKGKIAGVAIFDHPQNLRHPTWWHVRDYGLFAANPFGVHDFEGKAEGTGDITIAAGESLTLWYRFYFHKGNEKEADVAKHYREYAETEPPERKKAL